ncbi:hypothetical protein D3C76_685640 [compost metagenome]
MGLVDEQDDGFGRRFHFVDHALEAPLEFALHAGAGLQQAQVQRQQLDTLQGVRHFSGGDARGKPFDHGGLAHPGLADHDRIVLPPAGEDVDHLADRAVAAEHRIEPALAGLLGEVVGEAFEHRLALGGGCGAVGGLLRQGEVAQAVGVQARQQRLVVTAGVAHWVAQQGEDQRGLVDLALAQLQVGHQQGVLQPLHQLGSEHRVARGAAFAARLQRGGQFAGVHSGILQGAGQQSLGTLQQGDQQVFHEDLAAGAGDAALGCALQVTAGFGVQRLDESLQVEVDHGSSFLNECGCRG